MINTQKSESFDVLIWNSTPENLAEFDDPCGMVNVTHEHINISESEAYEIYNNADFYCKQLIKYASSDEDADGDVIESEINDLIIIDEKFKISSDDFDQLVESKVEDFLNDWSIDEDDFEESLNEIYGDVEICGSTFAAGTCFAPIFAPFLGGSGFASGCASTGVFTSAAGTFFAPIFAPSLRGSGIVSGCSSSSAVANAASITPQATASA